MRGIVNKLIVSSVCGVLLSISNVSFAGVNPFKKSKNYTFGSDVAWYKNSDVAVKSGSIRDGSDTNFYHLIVDKQQVLLRLGKNDPSGELVNTRRLDNLAITEVRADGRRLPLFSWCLVNQQNPGKKLTQNAVVANDVCINAGGGGDFIINLDDEARNILKGASELEFVVEPYGRPVRLTFSMSGFSGIMAEINKPVPVAKKPEIKPVVKAVPVVESKPKPVVKIKVKPKPKPVKICQAKAPDNFKSKVPAVAYPCENADKKSRAEAKVTAGVESEKKKIAAKMEQLKAEKQANEKVLEKTNKEESEWDEKQAEMWIKRCEKHWAKNRSPCYCEKYIRLAPPGISSTCGR